MPLFPSLDSHAIAERIRGLISAQAPGDIEATAERLGVREFLLRMSIDELSPVATLDVLAAVVNEFGVDPSWLLYGEYDSATHRRAVETDRHLTPANVLEIASSHQTDSDVRPNFGLEA